MRYMAAKSRIFLAICDMVQVGVTHLPGAARPWGPLRPGLAKLGRSEEPATAGWKRGSLAVTGLFGLGEHDFVLPLEQVGEVFDLALC